MGTGQIRAAAADMCSGDAAYARVWRNRGSRDDRLGASTAVVH
jgi:hypothetical protein